MLKPEDFKIVDGMFGIEFKNYSKLTRLWWKFTTWIKDLPFNTKQSFQRIIRRDHISDSDVWSLYSHLAEFILPRLKRFRKFDLHGTPSCFVDWIDDGYMGYSKEEYDKAKAEGKIVGGGHDAWLRCLDEMIYAFEHIVWYDGYGKLRARFLKKYGYEDPHKSGPIIWSYHYRNGDGSHMSCNEILSDEEAEKRKAVPLTRHPYQYDRELEMKLYERKVEGLKLFAKHFESLWD